MARPSDPSLGLLLLALSVMLVACGDDPQPTPRSPLPTESPRPPEPEAALIWIRSVSTQPEALRARLRDWPSDDEAFSFTTETQIALTWRLRLALEDQRIDDAVADFKLLVRDFEGEGESPEGATLSRRTMELGLFEAGLLAARTAMHAVPPNPELTASRLTQAQGWLAASDRDDRKRLEGQRRWLLSESVAHLHEHLGLTAASRAAIEAAQVLVVVDDFALGQFVFTTVLERWRREGAKVLAVPVLRRQVRVGQRLMPAESEAHELASLEKHAKEVGVPLLLDAAIPSERLESLGFGPQEVLLLIYDDEGRILARCAAITPDLRTYDPVIQRLLSR